MAILKIATYPIPLLRKSCRPVELIDDDERKFLNDMLETMYLGQGVGLAAPQVGILKRVIVLDVGDGPIQLVNPIVVSREGREEGQEGCLSLPDVLIKVTRASKIVYKGLDRNGKIVESEAEGLLARAIQHEIDHLDGRLIIDYVNPIKRFFLKRKLIKRMA